MHPRLKQHASPQLYQQNGRLSQFMCHTENDQQQALTCIDRVMYTAQNRGSYFPDFHL